MISGFIGQYRFLSNFYLLPLPIEYEGLFYPTVEHAYQAAKTFDAEIRKTLLKKCPTPGDAKRFGQHIFLRQDWHYDRVQIMAELLLLKFQPPPLRHSLLWTGDEELIESNHWHDNFWGICACNMCKGSRATNMLGLLLMEIRKQIGEKP